MSTKPSLSRADLLKCIHVYGDDSLAEFADVLGYATIHETLQTKTVFVENRQPIKEIGENKSTKPKTTSQIKYYRITQSRLLAPEEVTREEPDWYREAKPLTINDPILRANPKAVPPPQPPPLMRWSTLWPFLKLAFSAQHPSHRLDTTKTIQRIARAQILRDLPRKSYRHWTSNAQLIIDYADALLPFWEDFNELRDRLSQLRGDQGLNILSFFEGDHSSSNCRRFMNGEWQILDHYPTPANGTTVLVLSDLGNIDESNHRRQYWQRFGQLLRRSGCAAVALLPCPSTWWHDSVTRWFYPVCWDHTTRPPRDIRSYRNLAEPLSAEEKQQAAEPLLKLLAPAIRIEPSLLRTIRHLLPAHEANVGSEAAAWHHPHVHNSELGFYYDPSVIDDYRQRFKSLNPELRNQIVTLIQRYHRHLSPTISLEEYRIATSLDSQPEIEFKIDKFLADLLKTLRTQPDGELTEAGVAWILRLALRQHAEIWQDSKLSALRVEAHQVQSLPLPDDIDLDAVNWQLAKHFERKDYQLSQRGQMLVMESTSGSPVASVSARVPMMRVNDKSMAIGESIPLKNITSLTLRTDYQEILIDGLTKPTWAETIGRDEQGLFVVWHGEENRAYWQIPEPKNIDETITGYFEPPQWADACGEDEYGFYADFSVNNIVQRMRWIEPGEFLMGSPEDEPERYDDEIQHRVILTKGFWLADTACTQALWQAVMGDNPSEFKGADNPVDTISWDDAQVFIERLNKTIAGDDFRLPSEAEWEYACRAGTTTPFWFGEQITKEQVNYAGNYDGTVPVKDLLCNGWGLYQMHGNVREWCQDRFGDYDLDVVEDPTGPAAGAFRVLRGGSWFLDGWDARCAFRRASSPDDRGLYGFCGLRLARGQIVELSGPEAQVE